MFGVNEYDIPFNCPPVIHSHDFIISYMKNGSVWKIELRIFIKI